MGSLGLHALVAAAVFAGLSTDRLPLDAGAAIAVYVEPDRSPAAVSTPMPEAVAAADPSKEAALPDIAPPLPEALAAPDFSQLPPPPKPPQAVVRPTPPKPAPKPDTRRAAPGAASPAEQASSVPSPAPAAGTPATVAPGWSALLAAWLAANRHYPDEARRRHEEGEVTVRFAVAGDGRVSEATVVKGSGFATLDAAALRLLQGATLPAPGIEATRTVRIRFRLGD